MALSALVADTTSVVDGVLNAFGLSDAEPKYPSKLGKLVSNVIVENDKSWRKSLGYTFQVVRVDSDGVITEKADYNGEDWLPFTLQINPQELTQDEIFAIEVTPTFSGVLVEHQGTTLKDIIISGTTGLSPKRREGGAFPQSGRPVFAAGHSGYFEFHELRTYFRAYVEQKRNDPGKGEGELRLVWRNLRDHEDLFVEPQKFTMKRSATKPHLYEYTIHLKGIGLATLDAPDKGWLELIDDMLEDVQDALDTGVKLIQGAIGLAERIERDITNTLMNPLRAIAAAMRELKVGKQRLDRVKKRLNSLPAKAKSILDVGKLVTKEEKQQGNSNASVEWNKTYQASVNAAKEKDAAEKNAIAQKKVNQIYAASVAQVLNKAKIKELKALADEIYDNIAAALGVADEEYEAIKGKVTTLKEEIADKQITYEEAKTLYALNVVKVALDKMLATDTLFKQSLKADAALVTSLYQGAQAAKLQSANLVLKQQAELALHQAKLKGDTEAVKLILASQQELATVEASKAGKAAVEMKLAQAKTAKAVDIGGGDNIQQLAAKFLGSPDAFKELVIYNNLKPPYINTTPIEDDPVIVPGVLRPGMKIFVPQSGQAAGKMNTVPNDNYPITKNLSAVEKNFGVDMQLTDDFDLAVSNTGDIKLTAGSPNVAQGLLLKILLEPKSLQRHPGIGAGLEVGVKGTDPSDALARIRRSLERDNRVKSVIFAEIKQEGAKLTLNLVLSLKNVDQPIAVPVAI